MRVLDRVEFWIDFICANSQFPAPERLRAQFSTASFSDFCNCGCNSFAVTVAGGVAVDPIASPGTPDRMIFESAFQLLPTEKSLEILLFADAGGNLSYVEIDCNGNSEPVPDSIQVDGPPYHVYAFSAVAP